MIEVGFVLDRGHSAVIADITEDWPSDLNSRMLSLHGTVYRRSKTSVEDDVAFNGS